MFPEYFMPVTIPDGSNSVANKTDQALLSWSLKSYREAKMPSEQNISNKSWWHTGFSNVIK